MEQKILYADNGYAGLHRYLLENRLKNILLVCGASFDTLPIKEYFSTWEKQSGITVTRFSDFEPNPQYESVVKGVRLFHASHCDGIIAVGGGSAMDVAKCIKLYANMDSHIPYLEQSIVPNDILLAAVPTTSGTGSEATKFAVIYHQGEKQSVSDDSAVPSAVLMDASLLKTLPLYQKKATMMDAFCHAVESFWSVHSTDESKRCAGKAIQLILDNRDAYLSNQDAGNEAMLYAANYAGKAINIAATTAGHAMCYKLTTLYGIAHGHAAALCVGPLWKYMLYHVNLCTDSRGAEYLTSVFDELANVMHCDCAEAAMDLFRHILTELKLPAPTADPADFDLLKRSVNPERLKNNPIKLDEDTLDSLYHQILGKEE
ncbi:MAG: phosphonoacetaldehyde reductase [Bacteroidales bacterium]|nr:phosphonoacetaldehyde reductase [Bacteroidales bacterium]